MFPTSRKSQSGFSLIELMVVVAIIGVLASISVPSINKYLAKARQTEAKTNLSSIYTSEKAFYAEYTAYHSAFGAIGFSPEGKLRYNVGFGASGNVATAANGFSAGSGFNTAINARAFCVSGGAAMTPTQPCQILNGARGSLPPDLAGTNTVSSNDGTFTAGAIARISSAGNSDDTWTINQMKELSNTLDGVR